MHYINQDATIYGTVTVNSVIENGVSTSAKYEPIFSSGTSSQWYRGDKTWQILTSGDIPSLDASKITTGVMGTARLGTGSATSSTYLRGDGTWQTVATSGGSGATATSGLSDVSSDVPTNGQTLVYSSATSKYIPSKGTSIDFGEFTDTMMPGITWTSANSYSSSAVFYSIAYGNGIFVMPDNSGNNTFATSVDGVNWVIRACPAGNYAYVIFGGGIFLAYGPATTNYITSIDGINWTTRTLPATQVNAMIYQNGKFIGARYNTTQIITSTDGINWTTTSPLPESATWRGMAYGNDVYVLAGYAAGTNRIARSTDGITWTSASNPLPTQSWYDVCYGNGTFVAVSVDGATNRVITSPDGITWTTRTVPLQSWGNVRFGGGIFVAVAQSGSGQIMTSKDGITWTLRTAPASLSWNSICYGDGVWVAASNNGTGNRIMYSGRKRVIENNSNQYNPVLAATSGTAPRYVVADYTGQISTSPGISRDSVEDMPHIPAGVIQDDIAKYWTLVEMGAGLETIQTICYLGNGIVLAGAGSGAGDGDVYRSTDYGLTWSKIEMGATLEYIFSMCYLGNGIVLAGSITTAADGGDVYRSTDYGLTWTKIELGSTLEYVPAVCYLGNGIALAGTGISTGDGDIYRSTDYGLTWTLVEMGAALEQMVTICYIGNGIVLAGAGSGTGEGDIYRSVDSGVTWSLVEMGAALEKIYAICYLGNGIVLAGAGSGTGEGDIYRSTDYGLTWSKIEMGSSIEIVYSICYIGNGIVLASTGYTPAGDGDIYRSTDYGLTWSMIEMGAGLEAIYTICYLGNGIILTGGGSTAGDGDIYRSVTSWNTESANIRVIDGSIKLPGLTGTSNAIAKLTSAGTLTRQNVYLDNVTALAHTTSAVSWDCGIYGSAVITTTSAAADPTITLSNLAVGGKYQLQVIQNASSYKAVTLAASGYTIKVPGGTASPLPLTASTNAVDLVSMSVMTANELLVVTSKAFAT